MLHIYVPSPRSDYMCFCTRTDSHRHELFFVFHKFRRRQSDEEYSLQGVYAIYSMWLPSLPRQKGHVDETNAWHIRGNHDKEITTIISATTSATDVGPTLNPCTVNSLKRNCSILSPLITNYQSNQMKLEFIPWDFFVVVDPLFSGRCSNKSSPYLRSL